jgi:hypothetical protein
LSRLPRLSRPTLACLAVCAVVLAIGIVDYAHTDSRVPAIPPADCGTNEACNDARNAELEDRLRESTRLEQQYEARAWVYAAAIVAALAVATAMALRARRRLRWQRVFTNLGIAGVWTLIVVSVILLKADDQVVAVPAAPLYAPAVALIAAAAVGTIVGRVEGWGSTDTVTEARAAATSIGKGALGPLFADSRREAVGRFFSIWAFGLTAATVVLAIVFIGPQPACGGSGGESPPTWTDTIGAIAGITIIGALAAGIGALLLRRWFPALVATVVNPFALLFMAASTCAFY